MKKLTPNLMVKDVAASVKFYEEKLGFKLAMAVPGTQDRVVEEIDGSQEIVYALIVNGGVEIMLQVERSLKNDIPVFDTMEIGASVSIYIETEDLDKMYDSLNGKVDVVKELETTWYGMKEFYIRDFDGYILGFAEKAN